MQAVDHRVRPNGPVRPWCVGSRVPLQLHLPAEPGTSRPESPCTRACADLPMHRMPRACDLQPKSARRRSRARRATRSECRPNRRPQALRDVDAAITRPMYDGAAVERSASSGDFADKKNPARLLERGLKRFRRRPTLPQRSLCSTIGPGGLNFRVRDGIGWGPSGKATGNRKTVQAVPMLAVPSNVGSSVC